MTITAQKGEIGFGLQYAKYGSGTLAAAKATGRVVLNTNAANNDTLTVDAITYTYKTTLTPAANEIKIGVTATITASNTAAAINAGAGSGTAYGTGTVANATMVAVAENQTVFLTAITAGSAGNAVALSKSSTHITLTDFSGGLGAAAFDPTLIPWMRHEARDIDYDAQNVQSTLPLEVGRTIVPKGAYKSGVAVGGGMSILPRLENSIGVILLGALGSATTVSNSPESGVNTHTFSFDPLKQDYSPWMAVRKAVPGGQGIRGKGVIGYDNKVTSTRFSIPAAAPVEARVDFMGRVPVFDNYPESWTVTQDYESFESLLIACKASFKMPTLSANAQPVTQVTIDIMNNLTGPQQEFIIGSYFMDDIAMLTRAMTIRFMYKWYDPELYERSMGNALNATAWDPAPFITEKSGGNYAFQIDATTSKLIPSGTVTPYTLTIRATKVYWQPVGGVVLQAGGIVMQQYAGTVLQPTVVTDPYAEFLLTNGSASYTVPAAP